MSESDKVYTDPCSLCGRPYYRMSYLVNSAGAYGMPETWACNYCLEKAEPGSILADKRDRLYAKDFA